MNKKLDKDYWNERYLTNQTGWDIGGASTPLREYIDQLDNKDLKILIPGCGNAYEAAYLLEHGFRNVTLVDISELVVADVTKRYSSYKGKGLTILCDDFFKLSGQYDLVLEQTFFCALDPSDRKRYVEKMASLIRPGGKLVGLLFNRAFEGGPPFGGSVDEYKLLFSGVFRLRVMEPCFNSIKAREGSEVFMIGERV